MVLLTCKRESDDLVKSSTKWQSPFNERKCNILHFGNSLLQLDHQMNGSILEHVNDEKDFGVYTDKDQPLTVIVRHNGCAGSRFFGILVLSVNKS